MLMNRRLLFDIGLFSFKKTNNHKRRYEVLLYAIMFICQTSFFILFFRSGLRRPRGFSVLFYTRQALESETKKEGR